MNRIGNSGCFGAATNNPIDDIREAEAAVTDIVADAGTPETPVTEYDLATANAMAGIVGEYVRRVRLLTYAVVAIALYLVLKEA